MSFALFAKRICAEFLFNLFCRVKTHLRLCELRWNVFGLLPQPRKRTTTTTTRTTVRIRKVIIMTFDCCYLCCMLHSAAGLLSFIRRRRFNILYSCPEQWQKCWPLSASKRFSLHSTWTVDHLKRGPPCSLLAASFLKISSFRHEKDQSICGFSHPFAQLSRFQYCTAS